MSNGDDVLDNWEEIDEAGLNDTLQKIESERKTQNPNNTLKPPSVSGGDIYSVSATAGEADIQPMKLLQRPPPQASENTGTPTTTGLKSPLDNMAETFQPVMMVLHKTADEYQSANYAQPINTQTVKILRRPTQSSEPRNNGIRPRQPIKTLQQREQEYAEARLRILGSAKNPEDDIGSPNASAPTTATPSTLANTTKVNASPKPQAGPNLYNHYHQQQQQQQGYYYHQQLPQIQQLPPVYNNRTLVMTPPQQPLQLHQQQQTWSPVVGGSVSSVSTRQQQQQDSILRLPRGPDGSTGFQMRR